MILATIGNFFENAIIAVISVAVGLLIGYFAGRMGFFTKTTDRLKDE